MAQYDINLREYWRIVKKRKFTILLTAIVLGVFTTFFSVLRSPTPLYTSSCSIKFEKETTVEGLFGATFSWSTGDGIDTLISVIKSYSVMEKVAEKLGEIPKGAMAENPALASRIATTVENLTSKVEISREDFTNIINLQVTDADPNFTQRFANAIALTYRDLHAKEQSRRTTEALKYISGRLKTLRQQLRDSEEAFNRFTREKQLISFDLQGENLLTRAKETRGRIRDFQDARSELGELVLKLGEFVHDPSGPDNSFYSTYGNRQYENANATLVELLLKRDSLLKDFTTKHPEVIAIQRKIIENARKISFIAQLQIRGIDKRLADLRNDLVGVDSKTSDLMEVKLKYNRLKRKVDSYDEMTALLERKNQEALIRMADRPEEVTIVKPAYLPTVPINPPKTAATGTMGAIIGLILGMVLAFIAETFDTSLGAIEDVEETLGTEVLGVIPQGDVKGIEESLEDKFPKADRASSFWRKMQLAAHFARQSMVAEGFRALRTNIQFRDLENNIKTLAITSASPQEGKTTVVTNVAIIMAQAGMKTLLVEADLRKPTISQIFGVESSPGLSDVLLGNYSWRDVTKTVTDIIVGRMSLDEVMITPGLDNLHIITSGTIPPNPAELIDSKRLEVFIEEVKEDYDVVIFDTPPILSTADSTILGAKVDAILLVYRVGSVSRGLLKRATVQLQQVKGNLMGVVLNGMKAEVSPDFHDFKYYKSYYSYGAEEKKKKWRPFKLILALIALGLLILGLLWQNDILPIDKYLFGDKATLIKNKGAVASEKPTTSVKPAPSSPAPANPDPTHLERSSSIDMRESDPEKKYEVKAPGPESSPPDMETSTPAGSVESLLFPLEPASGIEPGPPQTAEESEMGLTEPMDFDAMAEVEWFPADPGPLAQDSESGLTPGQAGSASSGTPEEQLTATDSSAPADTIRYPYSLRTGTFKTLRQAEREVASLRQAGFSPYWCKVDLGEKGERFRVFAGYFMTRAEAREFKERNAFDSAFISNTAYAVRITEYLPDKALKDKIVRLTTSGYSPYVIGEADEQIPAVVPGLSGRENREGHDMTGIIGVSVGNLRFRPSTDSTILGKLRKGAEVALLKKQGPWYIVELHNGRAGWAHEVIFSGKEPGSESENPDDIELPVETGKSVTVRVDGGRVRDKPSLESRIRFMINREDVVSLVKEKEEWLLVELQDGHMGWAHQSLFSGDVDTRGSQQAAAPPLEEVENVFPFSPENEYSLLIGAFVTREAADELAFELKEAQIRCEVIHR